jgi:hypothetical protein
MIFFHILCEISQSFSNRKLTGATGQVPWPPAQFSDGLFRQKQVQDVAARRSARLETSRHAFHHSRSFSDLTYITGIVADVQSVSSVRWFVGVFPSGLLSCILLAGIHPEWWEI